MTNANPNKISYKQKVIMAEFMERHPNLARNLISLSAEGRAVSDNLWLELSVMLNKIGPPCKDVRMWKKVFADQKYQAKKKLSFNKILKDQMKPVADIFYEQKRISNADKLILKASGLEVEYENGITNHNVESQSSGGAEAATKLQTNCESIGKSIEIKVERCDSIESLASDPNDVDDEEPITCKQETSEDEISVDMNCSQSEGEPTHSDNNAKRKLAQVEFVVANSTKSNDGKKLKRTHQEHEANKNPVHNVASSQMDFQQRIEAKLDRLLDIQERMLKIQEEKHNSDIALNILKLKMKTLQYEKLMQSS